MANHPASPRCEKSYPVRKLARCCFEWQLATPQHHRRNQHRSSGCDKSPKEHVGYGFTVPNQVRNEATADAEYGLVQNKRPAIHLRAPFSRLHRNYGTIWGRTSIRQPAADPRFRPSCRCINCQALLGLHGSLDEQLTCDRVSGCVRYGSQAPLRSSAREFG